MRECRPPDLQIASFTTSIGKGATSIYRMKNGVPTLIPNGYAVLLMEA